MSKLPKPGLPVIALVLANLIPVFGVTYLEWDVGSIVVLYWTENLVIGSYSILKMLLTGGIKSVFLALFFCLHYGFFCAIHGIFVLELTGFAGNIDIGGSEPHWPGPLYLLQLFHSLSERILSVAPNAFLLASLALVLSHGVSFALIFVGQQEYAQTTVKDLMQAPYKRIVVLHIAIIAGGFLVQRIGSPLGLLIALVALKTGMDIMLHNRSHRELEKPASTSSPGNTLQGE